MEINYTSDVGTKFHKNGSFRYFPGNTVICQLCNQNELIQILESVQSKFKSLSFAHKLVFLPSYSFHMTVIDLVCEQNMIEKDTWPILVQEKTLNSVDLFFQQVISNLEPPIINMKYDGVTVHRIKLIPATKEDEINLKTYRKEVAKITGLNNDHENYAFHISLAYHIITFTEEEKQVLKELSIEIDQELRKKLDLITCGKPLFTLFNDMSEFTAFDNGRNNLGCSLE